MPNSSLSPSVFVLPAQSQQLELNIVTNPTAVTSATDQWTVSGMTVTRNATGSPLDPLVPTGFNMSSTANGQTFTTVALTVPSTLMNKKLKVEFYYTYVSGTSFTLDVLDGADVHYNLTTDVSGTTTLPQTSGKFTAYFDSNNTTSLKVRFSSTGTGVTKFTQLIVGPGIQPQGGAIDRWLSYTPTLSNSTNVATNLGRYRRVGDSMEIQTFQGWSGAGAGGIFTISLPAGFTVDTTKLASSAGQTLGYGKWLDLGVAHYALIAVFNTTTNFILYNDGNTGTGIAGTAFANGDTVIVNALVPIAEWSTSGTVNIAQNDVEYAYNTDTSASTNTTAFGYGPTGVLFPNITTNTGVSKTVQFQTPIQVGDDIVLEYYDPTSTTNTWQPLSQRMPYIAQGALSYGVTISPSTANRVLINFQGGGATTTNTTYAANGQLFSAYFSVNWKWRVRKSSAGSAVGFGIVQPGTSAGLVSASGLPGNTTGNAIAAGFVGEIKSVLKTTGDVTGPASAGTWVDITGTVSIDKGVYLAMYYVTLSSLASLGAVLAAEIYNSTTSASVSETRQSIQVPAGPQDGLISVFVPITVTTDGTLFKLRATANQAYSTSAIWRESLTASWTDDQRARLSFIRIA